MIDVTVVVVVMDVVVVVVVDAPVIWVTLFAGVIFPLVALFAGVAIRVQFANRS